MRLRTVVLASGLLALCLAPRARAQGGDPVPPLPDTLPFSPKSPPRQAAGDRAASSDGSGGSAAKGSKAKGSKASAARAAAPARPKPVWPVVGPTPRPGSILPGKRVVTFYGNPLSERMGILGRLPAQRMLDSLEAQAKAWEAADPGVPVVRALELVATVASAEPGQSGLYRTRMSDSLIARVIALAKSRGWHTILDVQVGYGNYRDEVTRLLPFLKDSTVHVALDPEFDMPQGKRPGTVIGRTEGREVSEIVQLLGDLVDREKLPPKLLLVHRFTGPMLRNAQDIKLDPRVQVAIVMDGFGSPTLKRGSYDRYVYAEPVQFTGVKLFYHHRRVRDNPLMSPAQLLAWEPRPLVIIYQ